MLTVLKTALAFGVMVDLNLLLMLSGMAGV